MKQVEGTHLTVYLGFQTNISFSDPEKIEQIYTPARAFECRNGPNDWKYKSTLIDRPDYTRVEKPNTRGKVLGGSSCLNYYTWVRGSKGTFDDWEEFGGDGWNWEGVKEYFDKVCISIFVFAPCANSM